MRLFFYVKTWLKTHDFRNIRFKTGKSVVQFGFADLENGRYPMRKKPHKYTFTECYELPNMCMCGHPVRNYR